MAVRVNQQYLVIGETVEMVDKGITSRYSDKSFIIKLTTFFIIGMSSEIVA